MEPLDDHHDHHDHEHDHEHDYTDHHHVDDIDDDCEVIMQE